MRTFKIKINIWVLLLAAVSFMLMPSCDTSKAVKGGAIGAAVGGAAGAAIGSGSGDTAVGAILGAAIGGTAGAIIDIETYPFQLVRMRFFLIARWTEIIVLSRTL